MGAGSSSVYLGFIYSPITIPLAAGYVAGCFESGAWSRGGSWHEGRMKFRAPYEQAEIDCLEMRGFGLIGHRGLFIFQEN